MARMMFDEITERPDERIFDNDNQGELFDRERVVDPSGSDEEYEAYVMALINDAESFEEDTLGPDRQEAEEYYQGIRPGIGSVEDPNAGDEVDAPDRSTIVMTEVRDTILAIMPSLVRIFAAREHPVYFEPNREKDVNFAEDATDFARHVVWEDNEGFMNLHSILKDCLNKKVGIMKWAVDKGIEVEEKDYTHLMPQQYQYVISQPGVEVVSEDFYYDEQDGQPYCDLSIRATRQNPMIKVEAVPPDEFRIDRRAKSAKKGKTRLIGHSRMIPVSDVIQKGYSKEQVLEWVSTSRSVATDERFLRNPGLDMEGAIEDEVEFGEYYIHADKDGDGIAELRFIETVGDTIISDAPAPRIRFALFSPDPEPHTAIGHSINELVRDLQKIKSNILRGILDSLAQSIRPRMGILENAVNMEDYYDDEIGAPIRMKVPGAITPIQTLFAGQEGLGVLSYMDAMGIRRTGQSDASKGLDPKALQSTSINAVNMVITGAQERTEMIARILAETGMKDLYKGVLQDIIENPNPAREVRINEKWRAYNPEVWDPTMCVKVNPAIGKGSDIDRFAMLSQIAAKQEMIITRFGPMNPIVPVDNALNTLEDMLNLAGMKNFGRYFNRATPEELQTVAKAMEKPDPAMILAQAEVGKVQAQTEKIRSDVVGKIAQDNFHRTKLWADDDFRRDDLEATVQLKGMEYNSNVMGILAGLETDREQREHDAETAARDTAASGSGEGPA